MFNVAWLLRFWLPKAALIRGEKFGKPCNDAVLPKVNKVHIFRRLAVTNANAVSVAVVFQATREHREKAYCGTSSLGKTIPGFS